MICLLDAIELNHFSVPYLQTLKVRPDPLPLLSPAPSSPSLPPNCRPCALARIRACACGRLPPTVHPSDFLS